MNTRRIEGLFRRKRFGASAHAPTRRRNGPHESSVDRYLELLKRGLANELYLENDLRLEHLYERISKKLPIVDDVLKDPARAKIEILRRLGAKRHAGHPTGENGEIPPWAPYAMGHLPLNVLHAALDEVTAGQVPGDFVDVGVGLGGSSMFMRGYLAAHEIEQTRIWMVDRFLAAEIGSQSADLPRIRDGFTHFDLFDRRVRFLQGEPSDSLADAKIDEIAVVRVGSLPAGDVQPTLRAIAPRLAAGAAVVIDTLDADVRDEAEAFRSEHRIEAVERVGILGSRWRVPGPIDVGEPVAAGRARIELPERTDSDRVDLSVIVVFYNMSREAQRTLYSMTRQYQLGLEDIDYEVLVIDNGSAPEHQLSVEDVRGFGPEFRLITMGESATSSPIPALVRGTAEARGDAMAFMIDGAHVLTPGVLAHGLRGLAAYAPAVVGTQQWYMGPGQQNDAMLEGYDEAFEDQLFDQIDWPSDGYKLFDIGSFIGNRDWLDGMWESNCLFAPRELLEQVGGFDDRYDEAGGGYANLDLYERLAGSPDATVVTILGEGSFHQTHGGTTTNQAEILERGRKLIEYRDKFAQLKGRPYRGAAKHMHYVGALWGSSLRSRARRLSSPHFARAAETLDRHIPMPDEAKTDLIATFFNTSGWKDTKWFGHEVQRSPTDLIAYQELIDRVRPEVIIVTNASGDGGLPGFLARVCDVTGTGRIIAVGPQEAGPPGDDHARITWIKGHANQGATARKVRDEAGSATVMVFVGRDTIHKVAQTFKAYRELVPVGSYIVLEDTIVNGNPVLPEFGAGPMEAARALLANFGDFMADPAPERFGLTFNPNGYLVRRTAPGEQA